MFEMTVNELYLIFRDSYILQRLKKNTQLGYITNFQKHILPYCGNADLLSLDLPFFDQFVLRLRNVDLLSNTSIVYVLRTFHKSFVFACKRGFLNINVLDSFDYPKLSKFEIRCLTCDQIDSLLYFLRLSGDPVYLPVLLACNYGLRRGEALAVRSDDFFGDVLSVRRTLSSGSGATFNTNSPKSDSGSRDILIKSSDLEFIRHYDLSYPVNPSGFMCRTVTGDLISTGYLQYHFKAALLSCGLPDVRFHDLRHSYAIYMLRSGVSAKIVSDVLGHCKVSVTLDLYSHSDVSMQAACIAHL